MRAPRSCPSPWWPTSSRRRSNCSTISRFSERSVPAEDRVRFQGEPVVAIAATTPEIAAAAADLVEIDYEDLPGVYDPIAALAPDAPKVHDSGNLLRSWHLRAGDLAQGFARAAVVVENTYRTPFVDHVYMETER